MGTFKVYKTGNVLHVIGNDTDVDIEANVFDPNVLISKKLKDDTDYYFHGVDEFNSNNKIPLADIQKENGSAYTYEEFELFKNNLNTSSSGSALTNSELRAAPIHVIVDSDLSSQDIINKIDEAIAVLEVISINTENEESLLIQIRDEITANGTLNHSDLINVISAINAIDANTDGVETLLTSIISNTANNATLTEQQTQTAILLSSNTSLGAINETAPATDTESSGLNGRLQRIAQRLSTIIGFLRLGQGTSAQSLAVTLSSEQEAIINIKSASATETTVNVTTATTTLANANSSRKKILLFNEDNQDVYVKLGDTASITSYSFKIPKDFTWTELHYTGKITAVTSAGASDIKVTEL